MDTPKLSKKWNKHIGIIVKDPQRAAGGISLLTNFVYLSRPYYVSINGLNPVPLHLFTVPNNNNDEMFLIGLDIINQHSSIISKFNGEVKLVIMNQKEEF